MLARTALVPRCASCIRRIASPASFLQQQWSWQQQAPQQQRRGKKKLAKTKEQNLVVVRLQKDIRTFGRKGSLVPVTRGQMRNQWYPKQIAQYVQAVELRQHQKAGINMDRDYGFGIAEVKKTEEGDEKGKITDQSEHQPKTEKPATTAVKGPELDLLDPQRALELLTIFLPPRIDFHRTPIAQTPAPTTSVPETSGTPTAGHSTSEPSTSTPPPQPPSSMAGPPPIYGSLSTADIVLAILAHLSENDEAARVVVTDDEVRFTAGYGVGDEDGQTRTRVKHLGEYEFEVGVRGASGEEKIRRTARVLADE